MNWKKMVAPVVITVLMMVYYAFFFTIVIFTGMPVPAKILLAVIPLALMGCMLYVLYERIKEIRSGEEDDLSQY